MGPKKTAMGAVSKRTASNDGSALGGGGQGAESAKDVASKKTAPKKAVSRCKQKSIAETLRQPLSRKTTLTEIREKRSLEDEWTEQYYQGLGSLDDDSQDDQLDDMGIGTYTFGTKEYLPFQSPYAGDMRIEIMSGWTASGAVDSGGCIRLCGPEDYYGWLGKSMDADSRSPLIIMIPFCHIEAVIIRTAKKRGAKGEKERTVHTVTIVPTGAVGASGLKRDLPQMIEFDLPDRSKDASLNGTIAKREEAGTRNSTYLVAFKAACDDQLALFSKQVIEINERQAAKDHLAIKTVWCRGFGTLLGEKGEHKGTLHLLPDALYFASKARKEDGSPYDLYIPLDQTTPLAKNLRFIVHKSHDGQEIGVMDLWIIGLVESRYWAKRAKAEAAKVPKRPRLVSSATLAELRSGEVELSPDAPPRDSDLMRFKDISVSLLASLERRMKRQYASPVPTIPAKVVECDLANCLCPSSRRQALASSGDSNKENDGPKEQTRSRKRSNDELDDKARPTKVDVKVKQMIWWDYEQGRFITLEEYRP